MSIRKKLNQINQAVDEIDSSVDKHLSTKAKDQISNLFNTFKTVKEKFDSKFYSQFDEFEGDEVFLIESLHTKIERLNQKFALLI